MSIEPSQPEADPSKISHVDQPSGWMPVVGGILGCLTAFLAHPILQGIAFRIFAALHVFRVVDEFDQIYSNESGQRILIWSLHLVLIALFALLYYFRYRKGSKSRVITPIYGPFQGDFWRGFAACALGWQIIAGSLFALLLTIFMNFSM